MGSDHEGRRRAVSAAGDPRHLGALIEHQLDRLLAVYEPNVCAAAALRQLFALLTKDSLDRLATPPFEGLSFINASGLPFQWVLSLGSRGHGLGFLCEVGRPGAPPAARLAQTLDVIEEACRLACAAVPTFLREAAAILLPASDMWPTYWRSAAWVGVGVFGQSLTLKPYFNLNHGNYRERWLRAGWLLKVLSREHALAQLCALSSHCSPGSLPVGLAIDILPDGAAGRVKLYFRSESTTLAWLARWHEGAGMAAAAPEVRRFLDLFGPVNTGMLPPGAMVVSLEIHADQRLSLKTDLAVTKWTAEDNPVFEAATAFLTSAGAAERLAVALISIGLGHGRRPEGALVRFVGLGFEPDGTSHLNLYLEPPHACPAPSATPRATRRSRTTTAAMAIRKGVTALLSSMTDNHWEDFALPVGRSDAWVTAYILAMLADLPVGQRERLHLDLTVPLAWLAAQHRPGGGWGYNGTVPDDADSTAWAIIALRAWGCPAPSDAVRFLKRCQKGAQFATYPEGTSPARAWAASAPDVSAVARRALGLRIELASVAQDGELEPAYWWTSNIYTTAMMLDSVAGPVPASLRERLARLAPAGPFERALLLRAAVRTGLRSYSLASELLQAQRDDGLWPPSARLRLAHDAPDAPWRRIDSGTLYVDTCALFTTATAVAALALFMAVKRHSHRGEAPRSTV